MANNLLLVAVILLVCIRTGSGTESAALRQLPKTTINEGRVVNEHIHDQWMTENGLPQNTITDIIQTRDGYIWLGTGGGLARFDGIQFTIFDVSNTRGLKSIRISSLYEDRKGAVWIGTQHGGLTRYEEGKFTTYTTRDGLPADSIGRVCEDNEGNLWISTMAGLARFDDGAFRTYTTKDGLPDDFIRSMCVDKEGILWIGSRGKLTRYADGIFTTYTTADGIPDDYLLTLYADRQNTLWIATERKGLTRWKGGAITSYGKAQGLASDYVFSAYEDSKGSLWIGTELGLARLSGGNLLTFPEKASLSSAAIRWVFEDREGNLWIGTNAHGLHRLKERRFTAYSEVEGKPVGAAVPIIEDAGGAILFGADALVRIKNGALSTYLPNGAVWSLLSDRDGSLWIGTWGGGLFRYRDGSLTNYHPSNSALRDDAVLALYQDRQGALWIGMGKGGLARFKDEVFTSYQTDQGLVHNDVRFITEDRNGALWVGTTSGLSRFKDGTFTNFTTENGLSDNFVRVVYEDVDGVLWMGTYGGGLNRFKDGKFTHYTTANGLFDNVVSQILEDDRGNFWMSCNRGIYRASREELNDFADGKIASITCVSYGTTDGMKSTECNGGGQPAGCKARDGRLWFPTQKGVVVVDPNRMNNLPPPVAIERVIIDKTPVDLWGEVEAPPGQGDMEIHYTALSFTSPEKLRFKYKLEGYDRNWVDAGSRRLAYYTNISPGQYTFRVMACNDDGVWNETGTSFQFYLTPHFYQRGLFYALCGFTLMLLGVAAYRYRVAHLVRRTRSLEKKVAERTSELVEQKDKLTETNDQLEDVNKKLEFVNLRLEGANDDLLSTLNQLRMGVVMTDSQGAIVFLSKAAQALIGKTEDEVLGMSWEQLLPLQEQDISQLRKIAASAPAQRSKVPVHLQSNGGRQYWMEIEVQDDPRDSQRKILFLYDVSEIYDLRMLLDEKAQFQGIVGKSMTMQLVYKQIRDVARVDTTVLIEGETGSGKELVARAIHYSSPRKNKPFIAVNCAGLTESLLTSQLFGHKRGAFTGATADQTGLFEAANSGTLFLDEIGDIPMSVQTTLLRVLQEKEITRLGESKPRKIDVRIIAATHRDLGQRVAEGAFRHDLLYRIRVASIGLPSLRDRREDIPMLVAWFLGQARASTGKAVHDLSNDCMQALVEHNWPGNVRELKSAIEVAVIRCVGTVIQPIDLPSDISGPTQAHTPSNGRDQDEKQRIVDALERAKGNRAAAARILGVGRTTLYRRLKELEIDEH